MSELGPVDAHHHLWDTAVRDYPWMDGPWADPLRGRFDAARYTDLTRPYGVRDSIVVQALQDVGETYDLLFAGDNPVETEYGDEPGPIVGVVGWVDLTASDVADRMAEVRESPSGHLLVGVRHAAQDEPDPEWLLRQDVQRGVQAVGAAGLVYDVLVRPPQAAAALALMRRLPEVSFVLDHAGKPDIAGGVWEPWATWITSLAALPNVTVKLSGLVTEAAPDWKPDDILPYARHVLHSFGADRVMYGSDWPVCTLAASYEQVLDLAREAVPPGDRDAVFGGTARRAYGLG
ncbi:amidohydrolase family protein [Actinoallomurus purpureus]|uniref:amidohydrolase family protein n=1 Tax=Actinoallomurus purpureus TaxID=478114 RepID=UPI0020935054|nr:amidohydrolase family protein [Actinoallomurus purpureus]MCO6006050.1 amidohydrolase family protein [Actinoallomurus purpureus]